MSWNELLATLRPHRLSEHVNVVLCGRAAANLKGLPGPWLAESEIVTFHRARYAGSNDELASTMDVVRLSFPSDLLQRHVLMEGGQCVAIIALDWLDDVTTWPNTFHTAVRTLTPETQLVITAVNFRLAARQWPSSAVLGGKIDACHQFLRVMASKYKASLVYSTDEDLAAIDWLAIISRVTGVAYTSRSAPVEQLVADPVFATYTDRSGDTKEKILALNPSFDYDAALEGELDLDSLVDIKTSATPRNELTFDAVLTEFDEKKLDSRSLEETTAESQKLFYDGIGTGAVSEDRKVISDFFAKIAQRSS